MDIRFENRYVFDRLLMKEYVGFLLSRQRLIGGGVAALALVMAFITRGGMMGAFFGACFLIMALALVIQGPMTVNRLEKANAALHNGKTVETVYQLYDDCIALTEGETSIKIQYAQVTSLHQTRSLQLLVMGGQNAVILKKDAFTVGEYAGLEAFLRERCKNL